MKKQSRYGLAFALVPLGALVILLTLKQTDRVLGEDGRIAVAEAAENPTPKRERDLASPVNEGSFVDKRAKPAAPAPLTRRQPGNAPRGGEVQFLTGPAPGDALDVALKYVRAPENRPGYTGEDFNDPKISSRYVSKHNGVTHIFLRQRHEGIEVYGADIGVNLLPDGRIINLHNAFVTDLASEVNATEPVLTAQEAIRRAAEFYELDETQPLTPLEVPEPEPVTQKQLFSPAGISLDPIPVKLTYVPLEEGVTRLAWNTVIRFDDGERWLDLNVDAETGVVLSEANWIACVKCEAHGVEIDETHNCGEETSEVLSGTNSVTGTNYNVFPLPLESPSDGVRSVQIDPQNSAASPFGWHDTNGVSGAEFTDTRGNNVNAQEDANANNTGGARPNGGASLNFDLPLDLAQAPSTYTAAVTANLFYWNNIIHDVFWHYGFDEPAGNFQENNYGNGGAASDPVEADSQDGSGTNNANFGTPPDGSNPRMQMFIWTNANPDRDSSLDNGIIIHEYGHGISNRLTGGPANSSALNAAQSGGMGEGWSDFLGLALTHQPGDTGPVGRGIGTYVRGEPPTGAGIRPFRYSTNLAVNPQHYGNLNGADPSNPHRIGSVWCTALWEVYWALVGVHGYNPDIYNGTGGNNIAVQLVIDGMKLQPANPSFLEARDAIITADEVNNGGANFLTIWTAFAKRGMGYSAYDGGSSSSLSVVAAFELPDDLDVTPGAGTPFVSTGKPGGPFAPSSQTYTLENTGGASLTWTASDNVPWLDLSVASGTLAAAATTPVNATINANANSLGLGTHTATVSFTNTISGATIARSVSVFVNDLSGAVDSPSLTFGTGGAAPWLFQTVTTHDGVDAAKSGAITHNQTSSLETTLTGPGTMTFWWKVSSEFDWDFLRFYLNGVEQGGSLARISGTVDWVQKTVSIPAGSQTVRWSYTKDGSVNTGSDAGWLDQVVYTPASAPEIVVEQPVGTILVDGSATIDFGSVNVGSSSSPVTFTIRNAGTANLSGLSVSKNGTHSGDYTLGSLGATTLAPGISTTFTITFAPGAAGSRTAAIQIASNDADENPFDINLTGTGVGPGTLAVTPAGGLTSSGNYGGPFSPSSLQYTLSNPGSTEINWTAAKTADWVSLSATGGALAAGADTTVTVSINGDADTLNASGYNDTVTFTNITNGSGNTTRSAALTVNPLPASVILGNLSQTYDGSPKSVSVTTVPAGLANSVTYDSSATVPANAGTYAVVATITDPNHTGSSSGSLVIAKASQTISFAPLDPVLDNAPPFNLTATATSGLAVSYVSSNTNVATVSGNTVSIVGIGSTTITASQSGNVNYSAAPAVPQAFTAVRANPLAVSGGPYNVYVNGTLSLNGSGSFPSDGQTVAAYEWDLNNDNNFGDVSGATPPAIPFNTLIATWGMSVGYNTIQLRITDSSAKTSTVTTTVLLISSFTWDSNGATAGQTNGGGAWLGANQWWDGSSNTAWVPGAVAIFGGPATSGGAVTLASPTTADSLTFNAFTGTYTIGTAGQALTLNNGIDKTSSSSAVSISGGFDSPPLAA